MNIGVEKLREWRHNAVQFVRDLFHVEPDAWQRKVLEKWSSPEPRVRIAEQACAGPGKTATEAWCGLHGLTTMTDGENHPNGAATAVTGDNLKNNLWKELAVWYGRSDILQAMFEMTSDAIRSRVAPLAWFLSARTFSKNADEEAQGRTLSGLHAKSIFYLVDESGDIPTAVVRTAEQGLSNCEWGRILQAGNPTSQSGALYHAVVDQAHLWFVVRITGDPDDPERSPRIDVGWARDQINLYGRDNAWVQAFILGLFPPGGINSLLGADEVRAAMDRHLTEDAYSFVQKRIGVDVARFGDDATVMFPRQGLVAFQPIEMRGASTDAIAARLMQGRANWQSELELIDDTGGWAGGVVDQCRLFGVPLLPINFSSAATDRRYFNKRSEMWFEMAKWVRGGGALPPVTELVAELTKPTYTFQGGQFRLEEKDQIKKRLGRSPNFADALALTFAVPDQPTGSRQRELELMGLSQGAHAMTEYDPLASAA